MWPRAVRRVGAVNASHPAAGGLWMAWGGETAGRTTFNAGRSERDGALVGAPTRDPRGGVTGTGSVSDYVVIANGHELTTFSQMAVITVRSLAAIQMVSNVAETPGSTTFDRAWYVETTGLVRWYWFDGAGRDLLGARALSVGQTYVLAATSRANDHAIYVNGVPDASTTTGGAAYTGYATPEITLLMGRDRDAFQRTSSSTLHAFCVWDRILSSAEIYSLGVDPWRLFTAASRPRVLHVPAAGGGKPWLYYARRRVA